MLLLPDLHTTSLVEVGSGGNLNEVGQSFKTLVIATSLAVLCTLLSLLIAAPLVILCMRRRRARLNRNRRRGNEEVSRTQTVLDSSEANSSSRKPEVEPSRAQYGRYGKISPGSRSDRPDSMITNNLYESSPSSLGKSVLGEASCVGPWPPVDSMHTVLNTLHEIQCGSGREGEVDGSARVRAVGASRRADSTQDEDGYDLVMHYI